MINKENDKEKDSQSVSTTSSVVDTAYLDIYGHIMIKDKDTNEVLVNKRG